MPKIRPTNAPLPELAMFPGRLKYARERLNMTRSRLAELTEIDAPRITRMEQGTRRANGIGIETFIRLARALDVSIDWLARDKGEVGPVTFRDTGDARRKATLVIPVRKANGKKPPPAPNVHETSRKKHSG